MKPTDEMAVAMDLMSVSHEESTETEDQADDEAPETQEYEADQTEAETDAGETDEPEAYEAETDEDDDPDIQSEQEPQSLHTVSVDGEEQQVTLDELKRGYSGQSYVQKGMQQNADEKKRLEAEAQQTLKFSQYLVEMYQRVSQEGFKSPPTPPSQELIGSDPVEYLRQKDAYEKKVQEYNLERQQLQALEKYQLRQTQEQRQQRLEEQAQRLVEEIPELGDADKAPKIREKLMKAGLNDYNFTAEELSGIDDARALRVLYDAARYRELQSGQKEKAAEKAKDARPFVKPKQHRSAAGSKAKALERMKTHGDEESVVNYLLT